MADQFPLALQPAESPIPRRRGRPPGARNRGSAQLGKYLEARYGGMTPGQQLAEIAMVKPAEQKRAKAEARERGISTRGMSDLQLAFVVKADDLAKALSIDRASAYAAQIKTLGELMPYIHQRQPQAPEDKTKTPATVFMIPEGAASDALALADFSAEADSESLDFAEDFETGGQPVGNGQSDDTA